MGTSDQAPRPRSIRVFVSSTFLDLEEERDTVTKRTFPALRECYEARGVQFSGVDLRAGIPRERLRDGEVVSVCLAEIDRCEPYFIGILGDRYGSVIGLSEDLQARNPWLRAYADRSITELEIRHGPLRPEYPPAHAYFYFRDGDPADGDAESRQLDELKRAITRAVPDSVRTFADAENLHELITEDFGALLDELFPEGASDMRTRERVAHQVVRRRRADLPLEREASGALDERLRQGGRLVVVTGDDAVANSHLVARWLQDRAASRPGLVVEHFADASDYSSDAHATQRRVMTEVMLGSGLSGRIPDHPTATDLAGWLERGARDHAILLVVDGIDGIHDPGAGATQSPLTWMPEQLPEGVCVLASCTDPRVLSELQRRGGEFVNLPRLTPAEIRTFTKTTLEQHGRALGEESLAAVTSHPACGDLTYLMALLSECRYYGGACGLEALLVELLPAPDAVALFDFVLARCEKDFERRRPLLVAAAMGLLFVSRAGLAEDELRAWLHESDGSPLPQADWSPLSLHLGDALTYRQGRIDFGNQALREAVRLRYAPTPEKVDEWRHNIIRCLVHLPMSFPSQVRELAWQLHEKEDWGNLVKPLTDPEFFSAAWKREPWEVMRYWASLATQAGVRPPDAYASILEDPGSVPPGTGWQLSFLLAELGCTREAIRLRTWLVDHYRNEGDQANVQHALGNLGILMARQGDYQGALALYEEEERLARASGDRRALVNALTNQGNAAMSLNDPEQALAAFEKQRQIAESDGDEPALVRYHNGVGQAHAMRGHVHDALAAYQQAAKLADRVGDLGAYQAAIGNSGALLVELGDLTEGQRQLEEQEAICRRIYHLEGLVGALGNRGLALRKAGHLDEAMAVHQEELAVAEQIGFAHGLRQAIAHVAETFLLQDEQEAAFAQYLRLVNVCRDHADPKALHMALQNLCVAGQRASISLTERGDHAAASTALRAALGACHELGEPDFTGHIENMLAPALHAHAQDLMEDDDLAGVLPVLEEMEELAARSGDGERVAGIRATRFVTLNKTASGAGDRGAFEDGLEHAELMVALADAMDDEGRRTHASEVKLSLLWSWGDHLVDQKAFEEAKEAYASAAELAERLGHEDKARNMRANCAAVTSESVRAAQALGEFERAIGLVGELLGLARTLDLPAGVADALYMRAWMLGVNLDDSPAALASIEEGLEVATQAELPDWPQRFLDLQRRLRGDDE